VQTVKDFIDAMNARDFAQVEKLLAPDFRMIDNADKQLRGKEACMAMFRRVTDLAPDYRLNARTIVERGKDILVSGEAETTSPEMASATQWRARAEAGQLREWQSYSNTLTPSMIAMVQSSYH
jgi:ketosteroid isomerase-like protein